jgi:hypothetical protein
MKEDFFKQRVRVAWDMQTAGTHMPNPEEPLNDASFERR